MKLIDDRVQKPEIQDLSDELVSTLAQALAEDYGVPLTVNNEVALKVEISKLLAKFFNVKL